MIKSAICQEFVMILNSYTSNNMALSKYNKFQNKLHGKTNSQSFWKVFYICLSVIGKISRQMINNDVKI